MKEGQHSKQKEEGKGPQQNYIPPEVHQHTSFRIQLQVIIFKSTLQARFVDQIGSLELFDLFLRVNLPQAFTLELQFFQFPIR